MGLFRRRKDRVDLEERSPQLGLKYKDLLVLDQLRQAGADFDQPRHVLHYLYMPGEDAAGVAASFARNSDYETEVSQSSDQWLVLCQQHDVVIDPAMVRQSTDFFEQLADVHGGDYDGWEASV